MISGLSMEGRKKKKGKGVSNVTIKSPLFTFV